MNQTRLVLGVMLTLLSAFLPIAIITGPVNATSNANCDKAGISENNGGNQRGNAQCFFRGDPNFDNSDPEPIRSGKSPQCQGDKPSDLDGDGNTFCNIRGN